jgi:hypothetical protein
MQIHKNLYGQINETDVIQAYQALLGRSPENKAVISAIIEAHIDLKTLISNILISDEFRNREKRNRSNLYSTTLNIDTLFVRYED